MGEHKEKKLDSKEIFDGVVFRVTVDRVELENGQAARREVVHHTGGAGILALNERGEIAMVRQYRYAVGQEMLEIPAGKIEAGEDPKQAAYRELQEETGYAAGDFQDFGRVVPTCAYCSEIIYLFLAKDLKPVGQHLDQDEFLSVFWLDFEEAVKKVLSGEIFDSKTVAAILKYRAML